MPKEKPKKPGKPKEKIDWSDIEPVDLERLLEEKEAGAMPADLDLDAIEEEKEQFYSQQASQADTAQQETAPAPEVAVPYHSEARPQEGEIEEFDDSDVFDMDLTALEQEKEGAYSQLTQQVDKKEPKTSPVAKPVQIEKPKPAEPKLTPEVKPAELKPEIEPSKPKTVEVPKPQPILKKPETEPKHTEKQKEQPKIPEAKPVPAKKELQEKPKPEVKTKQPAPKPKAELPKKDIPKPKPVPKAQAVPKPAPKPAEPKSAPEAKPAEPKQEKRLEETVAKEQAAPLPVAEKPEPALKPKPAKPEYQTPEAAPKYKEPEQQSYQKKEEADVTAEKEMPEGKYNNMVVLRRKFQQDPKAFLEKLLESLKKSEIHAGDCALPEFMKYLLIQDPNHSSDNKYKLKGLEKNLNWR